MTGLCTLGVMPHVCCLLPAHLPPAAPPHPLLLLLQWLAEQIAQGISSGCETLGIQMPPPLP